MNIFKKVKEVVNFYIIDNMMIININNKKMNMKFIFTDNNNNDNDKIINILKQSLIDIKNEISIENKQIKIIFEVEELTNSEELIMNILNKIKNTKLINKDNIFEYVLTNNGIVHMGEDKFSNYFL
jgi:hypothetical protein